MGCHVLLQGIFLTKGLNPCLLHWQEDSLSLNHQGSPTHWPYSSLNPTCVSPRQCLHTRPSIHPWAGNGQGNTWGALFVRKADLGARALALSCSKVISFPWLPQQITASWVASHTNVSLNNCGCQKSKIKVLAELVPSGDSEGQPPSLLQLPVAAGSLGIPGLSLAGSPFCLCLHKGFLPVCLCVPTAFCLAALCLKSKNTRP